MKFFLVVVLVGILGQVTHAGFLQSPFPYFLNHGDPITSAASPFIHGFGSPVLSPIVNYYHPQPQPILKTFYHQPTLFYQFPQFLNLPAPQFFTLPQTTPTTAPSSGGYPTGPPQKEQEKSAEQPPSPSPPPPVYGLPSTSSSSSQSSYAPPGLRTPKENDYTTGPSGSSANDLEIFQDDFQGNKESVIVNSDKARNQRGPDSNNFQSFIVNRAMTFKSQNRPGGYNYRDNSFETGQRRPLTSTSQVTSKGGYA